MNAAAAPRLAVVPALASSEDPTRLALGLLADAHDRLVAVSAETVPECAALAWGVQCAELAASLRRTAALYERLVPRPAEAA